MTGCKMKVSALTEHCVEEKKQLPFLSLCISGTTSIHFDCLLCQCFMGELSHGSPNHCGRKWELRYFCGYGLMFLLFTRSSE